VKDASNACIKCIESSSELISGEIYNVGANNQNFTKLDLAKLVQEYYPGIDIEVQEFKKDPRNYKVSFDKIQQKLGFITKNSVRDGVAEIVDGINNNTLIYKNSDFLTRAKLAEKIPVL
jgi:nucleoside-diphosphate-sugar epimerase